jgi:putative MATE family efflux protein
MPLTLLALAVGTGLLSGTASTVGRALGAADHVRVAKAGRAAVMLGTCCAIVMGAVFVIASDALVGLFAGPAIGSETRRAAKAYLLGVAPAYALLPFELAALGLLMGEGKTVAYGTAMALGTIVNLILDPLFMFVFGWGVAGAAVATSAATAAGTLYIMAAVAKEADRFGLSPRRKIADAGRESGDERKMPEKSVSADIVSVGLPQALSLLAVSLSFMFLNRVLALFGETRLNAWIVVGRIEECLLMIGYAVGSAAMFMASTAWGAKDTKTLEASIDRCLRTALGLSAVVLIPYIVLAAIIFRAFSGNAAVVDACVSQVRALSWSTSGVVVSLVAASALQGMDAAMNALALIALRLGLFLVLPIALLSVRGLLSVPLFFAVFAASSVGGGIVAVIALKNRIRSLPESSIPAVSSQSA